MNVELKQLSVNDAADVYEFLQKLPYDENGFINQCKGVPYDSFHEWLIKADDASQGIGLEDWMVPQTIFWLYADGVPVGIGKLRHRLTERLREEGGHIGYAIGPKYRGKGYGKMLLKLMLEKAGEKGIDKVLLTIKNHNISSLKVAMANGGVVEHTNEIRKHIWIDCNKNLT